jgi:hypothetical protein
VSAEKLKLYAVAWEQNRPRVVSVEAERKAGSWRLGSLADKPWSARMAFGYRRVVTEAERASMCIGLDAVDAVYLALESRKVKETDMEKALLDIRRDLTELAVLGLAEAKVTLCEKGKP